MEVDAPTTTETSFDSPRPHSSQADEANLSSVNIRSTATATFPLLTVQLSCKVQAVHRLWSPHLTEQNNLDRYGAATSIHGHEYTFRVTFKGALCQKTGQIVALDLLEETLTLAISEHLTRKNLDLDVTYFLSRPSTLEHVCMFAWRNIGIVTRPHPVQLVKVEVETEPCTRNEHSKKLEKVRVSYSGEKTNVPVIE